MAEESSSDGWKALHGASVQWPVDMPDDLLEFVVGSAKKHIAAVEDWQANGDDAVTAIKADLDTNWEPNWHVIVGRNFGSETTHESRRYCFFYLEDKAVLVFKA